MQPSQPLKQTFGVFLLNRFKILAGAFLFALAFTFLVLKQLNLQEYLIATLCTYLQLELFLWLGRQFFRAPFKTNGHMKTQIITRLVLFYLSVSILAILFLVMVFAVQFLRNGYDFDNFFIALWQLEVNRFFTTMLVGFALGALFFFYVQWSEALKREQQLQQEKLKFQYETLKNQLDPHFLFNNLNTLSSLIRKNPDESEAFIQKLALVYRYILENHEKQLVPLSEEIQFVRDYFFLRKVRDEEKIELLIHIDPLEQAWVLPVSLQLLVENALKHNSATRQSPLVITIDQQGADKLVVSNNLQEKPHITDSTNTGLKNLNQRCRLILNQDIVVDRSGGAFVVVIPLKTEPV